METKVKPSFAFVQTESKYNRRAGAAKRTIKILSIKDNNIEVLASITYSSSMTKGAHSEVYDYLFQHTNGLIPEDEYAKNNGYYPYSDSAIFIKELY